MNGSQSGITLLSDNGPRTEEDVNDAATILNGLELAPLQHAHD